MNYFFACYVYKCNYVMVRTIKSRKNEDTVTTFKEVYGKLKTKEHQPKFHVPDNECSKAVKTCIVIEKTYNSLNPTAIA